MSEDANNQPFKKLIIRVGGTSSVSSTVVITTADAIITINRPTLPIAPSHAYIRVAVAVAATGPIRKMVTTNPIVSQRQEGT